MLAAVRLGLVGLLGLVVLGALVACARQEPPSPPAEAIAASPTVALAEPGASAAPPTLVVEPAAPAVDPTAPPAPTASPAVQPDAVSPGQTARTVAETAPAAQGARLEERRAAEVGHVAATPEPAATPRPQEVAGSAVPALNEAAGSGTPAAITVPESAPEPPVAGPRRVSDAAPPPVSARCVAILDEASGELLYGQDEHTRVAPASVTKIATVLVALERQPDLDRRVEVTISGSSMAARDHSTIMGLEPGQQVSLGTLLYGMMLPSGNDAAEQVALALGGSREAYVAWMNEKVAALGLQDTHFVNPSGMDAAGHYSSAYDMAMLGRVAMRNEAFRQLAGAATYRGDGYNMANLNRLLGAYPGADGVKIGFTRAAGRTIAASATHDGHRVYVSLMRSQDLPGDSGALFDWVWRTFSW